MEDTAPQRDQSRNISNTPPEPVEVLVSHVVALPTSPSRAMEDPNRRETVYEVEAEGPERQLWLDPGAAG